MSDLIIQSRHLALLENELLPSTVESCAVIIASPIRQHSGYRLLAHDCIIANGDDYTRRSPIEAQLRPEFVARIAQQAKRSGGSIVFLHSHAGDSAPIFSSIDDAGEGHLADFLQRRELEGPHCAAVVSAGGWSARRLGGKEMLRVIEVGTKRRVVFDPKPGSHATTEKFDRQERVFGVGAQRLLANLKIAIVGLGGTGSIVAQQLAHLGVLDFILIDPDTVEESNLNRLAGASPQDVGLAKTAVALKHVGRISPAANVEALTGDIIRAEIANRLTDADVIFGCTDSHGSRSVIQQVAYQYLIPCIDMGAVIGVSDQLVTHVQGRVQLLAPGQPCLNCSGLLNPDEVRHDMMSEFERKADPYFVGGGAPAPAVMSLNSTISSLAVTMFLSVFAGLPGNAGYLLYDAIQARLRNISAKADPNCYICSDDGVVARGHRERLMARQD